MANLVKRWWLFNDWEKESMRYALSHRHQKNIPLALVPFYDIEDAQFAVELFQMYFALWDTYGLRKLKCKLTPYSPIMRLITFYVMRI